MASKALICYASTLVSNRATSSPLPVWPGPHSVLGLASTKRPASRPSLVVRAQQLGGGPKIDPVDPFSVRTPWNTSEKDNEIKMWFDMPGIAIEHIDVNIVGDLLVIKGEGGTDAFEGKILSPYDIRLPLPIFFSKEEIKAMFKNGVLYISVPKITKFGHKIIHIPVTSG